MIEYTPKFGIQNCKNYLMIKINYRYILVQKKELYSNLRLFTDEIFWGF